MRTYTDPAKKPRSLGLRTTNSRPSIPYFSLVLLCACFTFGAVGLAGQSTNNKFVGSETCQSCHDEAYSTVADSAHNKLFAAKQEEKRGCEACHGPGQAHVDGNGDASKIFRFTDARSAAVRARCGVCHESLSSDTHGQSSANCLSCHSVHRFTQKKFLLIKPAP